RAASEPTSLMTSLIATEASGTINGRGPLWHCVNQASRAQPDYRRSRLAAILVIRGLGLRLYHSLAGNGAAGSHPSPPMLFASAPPACRSCVPGCPTNRGKPLEPRL